MTILTHIIGYFLVITGWLILVAVTMFVAAISWYAGKAKIPTVVDVNLNGDKNASRR